jgi:hypothetical protein
LAACSPYFRAMFTGELAESRQTEVTIRDVDDSAMDTLVDFCYTVSSFPSGLSWTAVQTFYAPTYLVRVNISFALGSHNRGGVQRTDTFTSSVSPSGEF